MQERHNSNMREAILPLFPLTLVLLPRTPLPLHIFEERYKEMIGEALDADTEFGIVLVMKRGLAGIGCSARIRELLRKLEDGRMDILAEGRYRFEITGTDNERNFLRGRVRYFDDDAGLQPPPEELIAKVLRQYYTLRNLDDTLPEPRLNESQLSFQLGQATDDLSVRQHLLQSRSEEERLVRLEEHFPSLIEERRQTAQLKRVIPTNGHGKLPTNGHQ